MELIVCLKVIVDLQQVRVKKETREPILEGLPLVIDDMSKNALEESIRLKEKHGGRVTVLAVGGPKIEDTIIEALAMGADEAVILTEPWLKDADSMAIAKVLAGAVGKLASYDLLLLGEGSADNYSGQVGPRMAEVLGLPQITYVRQMEIVESRVRAVRDMEDCFEVVEASLPALVTVSAEINEPRLPALTQILRASSKPLHKWASSDIGISPDDLVGTGSSTETMSKLAPEQARKGIMLEGTTEEMVDSLVDALLKEGVLGR